MENNHICKKEQCQRYILPVTDVLDIIHGKWVLPIIMVLSDSDLKFTELEKVLEKITSRTLSKELKNLEINELVSRTILNTAPLTVLYSLTDYGKTLMPMVSEMRKWGVSHRERITGIREIDEAAVTNTFN